MKTKTSVLKTLTIALLAGLGLAGCVAVPVYDSPRVYGPPVVVAPAIGIGFGYHGHRQRHHHGGHGHRW